MINRLSARGSRAIKMKKRGQINESYFRRTATVFVYNRASTEHTDTNGASLGSPPGYPGFGPGVWVRPGAGPGACDCSMMRGAGDVFPLRCTYVRTCVHDVTDAVRYDCKSIDCAL